MISYLITLIMSLFKRSTNMQRYDRTTPGEETTQSLTWQAIAGIAWKMPQGLRFHKLNLTSTKRTIENNPPFYRRFHGDTRIPPFSINFLKDFPLEISKHWGFNGVSGNLPG